MIDLLTVFLLLPVVYGAALEFKDVKLDKHLYVSLMTAAIISIIYLIPAMLAQLGLANPLEIYGIVLPQELSLLIVVIALILDVGIYWLVVGITKLVESIVPGM